MLFPPFHLTDGDTAKYDDDQFTNDHNNFKILKKQIFQELNRNCFDGRTNISFISEHNRHTALSLTQVKKLVRNSNTNKIKMGFGNLVRNSIHYKI